MPWTKTIAAVVSFLARSQYVVFDFKMSKIYSVNSFFYLLLSHSNPYAAAGFDDSAEDSAEDRFPRIAATASSRHCSLRHERQQRVVSTYSLAEIADFQIPGDSLLRRGCC